MASREADEETSHKCQAKIGEQPAVTEQPKKLSFSVDADEKFSKCNQQEYAPADSMEAVTDGGSGNSDTAAVDRQQHASTEQKLDDAEEYRRALAETKQKLIEQERANQPATSEHEREANNNSLPPPPPPSSSHSLAIINSDEENRIEQMLYLRNSTPPLIPESSSVQSPVSPTISLCSSQLSFLAGELSACKVPGCQKLENSQLGPTLDTSSVEHEQNINESHSEQEDIGEVEGKLYDREKEEEDEYYGEQASEFNLRQLKKSTQEDVLICDKNRHSTEAARQMFAALVRRSTNDKVHERLSALEADSNSLEASTDSGRDEEDDYYASSAYYDEYDRNDNYGSIRLTRRDTGKSPIGINYGRTLVCAVSPTSQLDSSRSDLSPVDSSAAEDDTARYPIDGNDIRLCRSAFRENRRLIERVQQEAAKSRRLGGEGMAFKSWTLSAAFQSKFRAPPLPDRAQWIQSIMKERQNLINCSSCNKKLYPMDKIELDFARNSLNIHRNCFRCQICSTLLRLETYAAIDSKLYCPAHIKAATTNTTTSATITNK